LGCCWEILSVNKKGRKRTTFTVILEGRLLRDEDEIIVAKHENN